MKPRAYPGGRPRSLADCIAAGAVPPRRQREATECRWCLEGAPEWSYAANVWIHRRDRLDRRCEKPPNDYGYTTQVPEETISRERIGSAKPK